MKIQTWRRLSREDLGSVPEPLKPVIDLLLEPLNRQIESITAALQNNLTLTENTNSEIVQIAVKHGIEKTIKLQTLKRKPLDAFITNGGRYKATASTAPALSWAVVDSGTVRVRVEWPDAPTGEFNVRIIFMGA